MGVQDGQNVSAAITNPAFINKNIDDSTPSRLGLGSTATDQGASITWAQQQLNSFSSALGIAINQAYNFLPTWATNYVGAVNDTFFSRIAALAARFSGSAGHTHDGTDGNGPKVAASSLAALASGNVLGNISGSSASPSAVPLVTLATASTAMFRDVNANSRLNNLIENLTAVISAAGTTILTVASTAYQRLTGTTTQTYQLPDATTLPLYWPVMILNRSTGNATVNNNGAALLQTMKGGTQARFICTDNTTTNGVWDVSYTGGVSAGGGGGGSLRWVEDATAPSAIVEFNNLVYFFVSSAAGQQVLWALLKVPTSYVVGSPITLKLDTYSPDSSGTNLILNVATLIRQGVDAMTSTTNQHGSTNTAVTLTVANVPQALTLDLTDSTGKINAVAVNPGDFIKCELYRGSDTGTSDIRVPTYAEEVTFS